MQQKYFVKGDMPVSDTLLILGHSDICSILNGYMLDIPLTYLKIYNVFQIYQRCILDVTMTVKLNKKKSNFKILILNEKYITLLFVDALHSYDLLMVITQVTIQQFVLTCFYLVYFFQSYIDCNGELFLVGVYIRSSLIVF